MIDIEAPNRNFPTNKKKIFLGGGITHCPNWQQIVIDSLQDLDVVLFNPRRKNFPIDNPDAADEQIRWEFDMFRNADIIVFWFCKESICPVVLYDLGAHSMTDKPLIIGVHPEYERKKDIEVQTELVRPDVKIVYSLDDFIKSIRQLIQKGQHMKHLAIIQVEFIKEARKWDDLTLEEQKSYLKRHPKSKRRVTALSRKNSPESNESQKVKKKLKQKIDDVSKDKNVDKIVSTADNIWKNTDKNVKKRLIEVSKIIVGKNPEVIQALLDHSLSDIFKAINNQEIEIDNLPGLASLPLDVGNLRDFSKIITRWDRKQFDKWPLKGEENYINTGEDLSGLKQQV